MPWSALLNLLLVASPTQAKDACDVVTSRLQDEWMLGGCYFCLGDDRRLSEPYFRPPGPRTSVLVSRSLLPTVVYRDLVISVVDVGTGLD